MVSWNPGSRGLAALALAFCACAPLPATELKDRVLVVFNTNDPESARLAEAYASARGIPPEKVFGLSTAITETIHREEFNRTIREPLARHMEAQGWMIRQPRKLRINGEELTTRQANGNQIWAIALIRGIPLRIENDPTVPTSESVSEPMRTNAAAVDSELALLPLEEYPIPGLVPNPYYHEERIRGFNQFLADSFIMVTRLDGPTPGDVQRMIRDSIETEKMELTGRAYFDTRGLRDPSNPYTVGDDWIRQARAACRMGGFNAELDEADPVYPEKLPWEDVALYAGWYERDVRGPFNQPGFRFAPGAVAYHIHSFSAESLRNTHRFWSGPLIERGAAATMGNVYEPYLRMTPNVGVFFRALLEGLTFAEAAYHSQVGLSWMSTFIGDPLYRPFPRSFLESLQIAETRRDRPADWMIARTLRLLAQQEKDPTEKITTLIRAAETRESSVVWEECGDLVSELGASSDVVIACYDKAGLGQPSIVSRIRLGLKTARQHQKDGDSEAAMSLYEKLLAEQPLQAPRYGVPQEALNYASSVGWTRFSPAMKSYLAPVGVPPAPAVPSNPASPPARPTPTTPRTTPSSPNPTAPPGNAPSQAPPVSSGLKPTLPAALPPGTPPTQTFKPAIE